jgi:hypothetical protein
MAFQQTTTGEATDAPDFIESLSANPLRWNRKMFGTAVARRRKLGAAIVPNIASASMRIIIPILPPANIRLRRPVNESGWKQALGSRKAGTPDRIESRSRFAFRPRVPQHQMASPIET